MKLAILLAFVVVGLTVLSLGAARPASAAMLPITSSGSLGPFNPGDDTEFDTDAGTYVIGTELFTGGREVSVFSDETAVEVMVFDFTTIHIPDGVAVTATGSRPLILLAETSAIIGGLIDVSGQPGGDAGPTGGGGGGGAGGAVAIFADSIFVSGTGQVLASGGDGGLPIAPSGGPGSGGVPGPAGGAGGAGGSSAAGGAGGGGGNGGAVIGRGGGGGGGGAYAGGGGPAGASGWWVLFGADAGLPGTPGACPAGVNGGKGGDGAGAGVFSGDGGAAGTAPGGAGLAGENGGFGLGGGGGGGGGATLGGGGGPGGAGSGLGGGGGGGGGADTCVPPGPPGAGGGGGGGPGGGGGGNGIPGGGGVVASVGAGGGAGGGGAIDLGAASDLVENAGLLSAAGGASPGQQGGLGVIRVFGTLSNSGTLEGNVIESHGHLANEWIVVGGGGGAGAGAPGKEIRVGGIVELPVDGADAPASAAEGSGSSAPPYAALAGGIAAAAITFVAGGWYARRRLS